MRTYMLAAAAAVALFASGSAMAAPAKHYGHNWSSHRHVAKVTPAERVAIAYSLKRLNAIKWQARRDDRITAYERMRIRVAQAQYDRLVWRARRS